jgi:deoxyribose-phosphate aldolase
MEENLAGKIDHTLLKPEASDAEIRKLCEEAKKYYFASVCINPKHVRAAAGYLKGTGVSVCTVIGFPLGANTSEIKAAEAEKAVRDGADECDMVIDIGSAKEHDYDAVEKDVAAVRAAVADGRILKVIIEACLLTDEEKREVCRRCVKAKADFVKTSTGFSKGGATAADVRLMTEAVGGRAKVKAAGGIRDRKTAEEMIAAGADRIGTSHGVEIVTGGE